MAKSHEEAAEVVGRAYKARRRRFDASSLFGGEPPTLYFDDLAFDLLDISSSGLGARARDDEGPGEANRPGVLRLVQRGEEIFRAPARVARFAASHGAAFAGIALEREELDLADLQHRNSAALALTLPEIATGVLLPDDNRFLRSDRRARSEIGDISALSGELDRVHARFVRGDIIAGMADGREMLLRARADFGPVEWRDVAVDAIRQHPLASFILRCPLTRRSYSRPRGYSGDAPLLDQIYGTGEAIVWPHPSSIAGQVSFFVVHSSACRAVRQRREILAREIDETCRRTPEGAKILSVACGHLRELGLSTAARAGAIGNFLALDQDAESLREVRASVSGVNLETIEGSVRGLISKKVRFHDIDFAYAAGLLDYLVEPVAMRLIERMFSFLNPGGRLLIANFTPAGEDIGYMESFMDWWLIYRTSDQLTALLSTLPREEIAATDVYEDDRGVIAYAVVEKAR